MWLRIVHAHVYPPFVADRPLAAGESPSSMGMAPKETVVTRGQLLESFRPEGDDHSESPILPIDAFARLQLQREIAGEQTTPLSK